jgi:hypothetical protein
MEPVAPETAVPVVALVRAKVVVDGAETTVRFDAVKVVIPVMEMTSPATSPWATLVV